MGTFRSYAAISLAVVMIALLGGCDPAAPGVPAVSGSAGPTASGSAVPPSGTGQGALAVYYLGTERIWRESDGQPVERIKLYREFHRPPAGDGGAQARTAVAVARMLDGSSAADPDYRSGWPAGARVREVRVGADAVTVDLGGVATNNVGAEAAAQAVQQLIWTATAVSGRPVVRLLVEGRPVDELWGHVAVGGDLRRGRAVDVLALVWLIDPQHGASVAGTFTIHVSAAVPEGTVQLRARQAGRTVKQQFVTAGGAGSFGEAKATMTLPPGSYLLEAYAESMVDGRPLFLDDHTITVR